MPWIEKEFPTIKGYESLGDTTEAKRWLDFKINQLLDTGDPLWEMRDILRSKEDVCNFVISQFDYPMHQGKPCDKHRNNWFEANCCHTITVDFWQQASETLRTLRLNERSDKKGFGDCEDVSVLFTTLFLMKRWEAWECLGYVLRDGVRLGGHGWSIFNDGYGVWRLYEATLSTPPQFPVGYPVIQLEATEWEVGSLTYQGLIKFNSRQYYVAFSEGAEAYFRLSLKAKETRLKHEAISTAWGIKTKPLARLGLLSKLRWR